MLYMASRSAYKEMSQILNEIHFDVVLSPTQSKSHNPPEFKKQLNAWNQLIQWEHKNPLHIEDSEIRHSRIMFWYRLAVVYLRFCPQMWFSAASYLVGLAKLDEAASFFSNATKALPESLLVHFSYADFEENNQKSEVSKSVYETLLNKFDEQINQYVKSNSLTDISTAESQDGDIDFEKFTDIMATHPSLMRKVDFASLTYIHYMRFIRRTEGIKSSRQIFSRARRLFYCTPHIYIAAALMEYFCTKDSSISVKIFELGMKRFMPSAIYAKEYLKLLIMLNDDNNTRSLFERIVAVHSQERDIWDLYLEHVCKYCDLEEIQTLQKRYMEIFTIQPQDSTSYFVAKYQFLNMSLDEEIFSSESNNHQNRTNLNSLEKSGDILERFLKLLPLPSAYNGPIIPPDEIMSILHRTMLVQRRNPSKRRRGNGGSDIEDDAKQGLNLQDNLLDVGPKMDLFRVRQQQKRTQK